MTWIKLDDKAPRHPKVSSLSDRAFRVWIQSLCYASEFLTDGHLPAAFAKGVASRVRDELLACGLWEADGSGVVTIHDYLTHQTAKSSIERERERNRARRTGGVPAVQPAVVRVETVGRTSERPRPDTDTDTEREKTPALAKPGRYAHALIPKRDLSALYEGRFMNIPAGRWADGHRKAYRLTDDDLSQFGAWVNDQIERDGGTVEDGGNRLRWLDERLAVWRGNRADDAKAKAGIAKSQAWLAEQARISADVDAAEAKAKADGTYRTFAEIAAETRTGARG